jgi:hypothetical protein
MPNFDGTGPLGQGAMTGRRRGRCVNVQTSPQNAAEQNAANNNIVYGLGRGGRPRGGGGFANRPGGGFGLGRGRGRGFGNR